MATIARAALKRHPRGLQLFLDLDGVLADFELAVEALLGDTPDNLPPGKMWGTLARHHDFFGSLPLMPDAMQLWEFAAPYNPVILTGAPRGNWAEPQKRKWVRDVLGPHVQVIVCLAKDKGKYCSGGAVLVDDMLKNRAGWVEAGGTFVLHTAAASSIAALQQLGFT